MPADRSRSCNCRVFACWLPPPMKPRPAGSSPPPMMLPDRSAASSGLLPRKPVKSWAGADGHAMIAGRDLEGRRMDGQDAPGDRRPIGFWLKLVDGLIDAGFDALLGEQQFTRRHWQVLNLLSQKAATVAQIDAKLTPFLTAGEATTRPILDDLHRRGLVEWVDGERASLTLRGAGTDRKSTRLNSSHVEISYAVFCLKKKNSRNKLYTKDKKKQKTNSER